MEEINSSHDWDFEAGRLPLNFANTAEWHASGQPREMLESYSDLVAWAAEADLLSEEEVLDLLAGAEVNPTAANSALEKAIELREAIFKIFSAVAREEQPDDLDIALLNKVLVEAMVRIEIVPTSKGFARTWVADKDAYDRMLWPIAHSSAEFLTSEDLERVGRCEDDRGCGYLFYDTSRNRSRRWCSMEICGNRAKAQRHYQRQSQKVRRTDNNST
jgi:predicted RNA-binding Zn ribbon-like protein